MYGSGLAASCARGLHGLCRWHQQGRRWIRHRHENGQAARVRHGDVRQQPVRRWHCGGASKSTPQAMSGRMPVSPTRKRLVQEKSDERQSLIKTCARSALFDFLLPGNTLRTTRGGLQGTIARSTMDALDDAGVCATFAPGGGRPAISGGAKTGRDHCFILHSAARHCAVVHGPPLGRNRVTWSTLARPDLITSMVLFRPSVQRALEPE